MDRTVIASWAADHPTENLLVWASGGKDSFCCLKLAVDVLGPGRVVPVFRYLVEGVRCVETPIRAQLRQLGITHPLVSVPGVDTLEMLRQGVYTKHQAIGARQVKYVDVERLAKKRTGCDWCASGEKMVDTPMRRLWLREFGGIDTKGQRLYPVHDWTQGEVRSLCTTHRAPLAPTFGAEVTSGLSFQVLDQVKVRYPDDYARIVQAFPFCEALAFRDRTYGARPRSIAQLRRQRERADQVPDGGSAAATPPGAGSRGV